MYAPTQHSNDVKHCEIKWSYLMCLDIHGVFFILTSEKQSQRDMIQPAISTQWKVGTQKKFMWNETAVFSEKQKD